MQPKLKIGNTDITQYVAGITPANNDLDAEGAGRDVSTGTMYRKKIADKDGLEVAMMRIWEDYMPTLRSALNHEFVSVQYLNPGTNALVTRDMYCSSISYGLQMYDRKKGKTYYEGCSFTLTEK